MPLATKDGALIVKDGSIAERCECCSSCHNIKYAKFEWLSAPPASTSPSFGAANDAGFCACYWSGLPMTYSLPSYGSTCVLVGGVPLAGLRNSRRHIMTENSAGTPIPIFEDPFTAPEFRFSDIGGAHRLYATETSLILEGLSFGEVTLGAHAIDKTGEDPVINGATVPNAITGNTAYNYRISATTREDVHSLWTNQNDRSLKDCQGNKIFDAGKSWAFDFAANAPPLTESGFAQFWSDLLGSGFSKSATAAPARLAGVSQFVFGFGADGGASIETSTHQAIASQIKNAPSAACSGCQVRFLVTANVRRSVVVEPFTLGQNQSVAIDVIEDFMFDNLYSSCLNSARDAFSLFATRRVITFAGRTAGAPPTTGTADPGTSTLTIQP